MGKACSLRKVFVFKALHQIIGQGLDGTDVFGKFVGGKFERIGGFHKGFVGQGLLIGRVQNFGQIGGDGIRHAHDRQG